MTKAYLNLQPSEQAVAQAASRIYSAYVIAGKVGDGEEAKWLERSLREAVRLARSADDCIIADGEME